MKRCLRIGVLIFLTVAVTLPAWSRNARAEHGESDTAYFNENHGEQHQLGGKSTRACRGLSRAAENKRSRVRRDTGSSDKPSDDADDDVSKGNK
jgi:hypothetical protein